MQNRTLGVGAVGLGRAFMLMLPTFVADARVRLVAAADPDPDARARFVREFGGSAYASVAELCADQAVDVVSIATPHEMHAEHVGQRLWPVNMCLLKSRSRLRLRNARA